MKTPYILLVFCSENLSSYCKYIWSFERKNLHRSYFFNFFFSSLSIPKLSHYKIVQFFFLNQYLKNIVSQQLAFHSVYWSVNKIPKSHSFYFIQLSAEKFFKCSKTRFSFSLRKKIIIILGLDSLFSSTDTWRTILLLIVEHSVLVSIIKIGPRCHVFIDASVASMRSIKWTSKVWIVFKKVIQTHC